MPQPKKTSKAKLARTAPAKASAAKKAEAPAASAPPTDIPTVNPAQSAAAAAAIVVQNANQPPTASSGTPQPESALFRNLKGSLNKPHSQIMSGLLDKLGSTGSKKSSQPFSHSQQVGRDQTIGGDATRRNVPRRTGG
jgi:hypothetical protein